MPVSMHITGIQPKVPPGHRFGIAFGLAVPHELVVRPEAEVELADAYAWYEQRVHGLGEQFILSVDAVFQAIIRGPQQYPQVF